MKKKTMELEAIKRDPSYADSIVNTVREPLIILNGKLRVVSANKSFYNSFKVKPKETVGQLIYDLGNRQWNIPKLRKLLEGILPKKKIFNGFEVEHKFSKIGQRTMLLNARQLTKTKMILLAIEDITERNRLQETLKESEERFRRAFETSDDGLLLVNKPNGDILNSNKSVQELLGYRPKEFLKRKLWEIGMVKSKKDFQNIESKLEKNGLVNYEDTLVKTKNGRSISADVFLVDRAKVIQCNIRDITERKKDDENRIEFEQLKGSDILKTQFLSITSHELRTPMTPMKAQLQMLLEGYFGNLNENQKQSIGMILRNTERLDNLIVDILDISRIQSGKLKFELKKVQPANCIRESIIIMKPLADEKNIAVTTKIDKLPKITIDKGRVTQVLINLIDNAIKFTPEKGKITIEAKKQKNDILVKVEDTGIGISEENLKRLFIPFSQIDSSYSRKYKGTGLGLAICKGIVEQQGGEIFVKSKLGKGSTFYFTLPLRTRKMEKQNFE